MQLLVWRPRFSLLPLFFYAASVYADNEDTFRQLHQGLELYQQRQERTTIGDGGLSFASGAATRTDNLTLALLQAINNWQGDEIRRLLALYQQLPDKDADMVLFARANVAIADNDLSGAIALYRQLYDRNPLFLRGRLDLARLLFIDQQNRESHQLFHNLYIAGHPQINQKIRSFVDALDDRTAWRGSLSAGPIYVSNLNQSSEGAILRPQRSCEMDEHGLPVIDEMGRLNCNTVFLPAYAAKAVSATGLGYELSLNKLIPLRGHHNMQLLASGFGRWYRGAMAYNEHNTYLNPSYLYQNKTSTFGTGPVYQLSMQGRRLQNSSSGLNINISHAFSPRAYAGLQAQYKYDNYRSRPYQRFNGVQGTLFTNLVYVLADNWVMFGGYDFLRKSSREQVDSFQRHGVRLGLNKKFSWGADATLQASWRKSRYQDYNAWLQTRRRDQTWTYQLDVKLDKLTIANMTPVLSYQHTRNHSSSWVNDYKSDEWFLKFNYTF